MLCALIMAGGKGTRFWPLSTEKKPKQFLKLLSNDTMIQMTVNRIKKLIPLERIFIVTGKQYVHLVKEQLPNIPKQNIIVEPIGRNTAPCIALSAFHIDKIYKNSTILVLPSDHLILDNSSFLNTIDLANKFIENNQKDIITLGIKPNRPETGYGYIKHKDVHSTIEDIEIKSVDRFVEKPTQERAIKFLQDGHYLWNSGMFMWKTRTILELTKINLENTFNILYELSKLDERSFKYKLETEYHKVDNISVDYAIMEKANNIYTISCDFGWDDVGTWNAVVRYREKDSDNNICIGNLVNINSRNNITASSGEKPIVVVGIEDACIVENDEMIFVGRRKDLNNIKETKNKVLVQNF